MPEFYDRYMGPIQFKPYAEETAKRISALNPSDVLETACGTGQLTYELRARLGPSARLTATDLSQDMLDFAIAKEPGADIIWKPADAQALPFSDHAFDLVVSQFGVMFYPDRGRGFLEAKRVLRPGGAFIFTVWDTLEQNELPRRTVDALAQLFPSDPPTYNRRVPYGYNNRAAITADLNRAGFLDIQIEPVTKTLSVPSARDYAIGSCQGATNRIEIEKRDPSALQLATEAVARALEGKFGSNSFTVTSQALFVSCRA
jgi:SAM-dependent methyltransferase